MTDQQVRDDAEEALIEITATLARHDRQRDDLVARQHELIKALKAKHPQMSLRQLGGLARMSYQNVALILGWQPPRAKSGR